MNNKFEPEFARFCRAFERGTPEYALRTGYPGDVSQCDHPECANGKCPEITTYWLCDDCGRKAPDTGYHCIHAPSKAKLTDAKRRRNNIAAFAAHCVLARARMPRVSPADGAPSVLQEPAAERGAASV